MPDEGAVGGGSGDAAAGGQPHRSDPVLAPQPQDLLLDHGGVQEHDGDQRQRENGDVRPRLTDRLAAPQQQEVTIAPDGSAQSLSIGHREIKAQGQYDKSY
ncbi:hypothetical protein AB0L79_16185 [Streptomyces tendae]|uniref:hypothetical protein n=1 Tax=Streptomyces tendae TaxID=1932 RepID=UPI00342BE05E